MEYHHRSRIWLLVDVAPLVIALLLWLSFGLAAYLRGLLFAEGEHRLAFMVYLFLACPLLLVPNLGLLLFRTHLSRFFALSSVLVLPALILLLIATLPDFFRSGRDRAFEQMDHAALFTAAKQMHADIMSERGDNKGRTRLEPDHPEVSAAFRDLPVQFFVLGPRAMVVQLDGGGEIVPHEGLGFVIQGELPPQSVAPDIRLLDEALPVFQYVLDDHQAFFDLGK